MNKLFFLVIQLIPFTGFIWSSLFFFQKKQQRNFNQSVIRIFGLSLIVANLYFTLSRNISLDSIRIFGVILMFMSAVLFFWSIRTHRKNPPSFAFSYIEKSSIVMTGPYQYIRHPFYASYIYGWLGGCLINQNWFVYFCAVVLLIQYIRSSALEEKGFLEGPSGKVYQDYIKRTGRFFPVSIRSKY